MNQHQQLYDAVVARPREDQPRLAFADHVEPTYPKRARFIRLQLARIQADLEATRWRSQPSAEERELLKGNAAEWAQMIEPLTRRDPGTGTSYEFNRGFIERVRTTAEIAVSMSSQLFKLAPILHLDVIAPEPGGPTIDELLQVPQLRQLDSLILFGWNLGDAGAAKVAMCEHLGNLSALNLRANRIGRTGIDALAASPITRRILTIDLGQNNDEARRGDYDDIGNLETRPTELGRALEVKYGPIPWVHEELTHNADDFHLRYAAEAFRAAP